MATPTEDMQTSTENGTATAIHGHNHMFVGSLSIPALMKYAFALGVPTRKKSSNGHRYRRAVTHVRADCVAKQRQGSHAATQIKVSLPGTQDLTPVFDSSCKSTETGVLRDSKSANSPGQSLDLQETTKEQTSVRDKVMELAAELGIETRSRDKMNRNVWRGVKEVWKDVVDCWNPCHAIGTGSADQLPSLHEAGSAGTVDKPRVRKTRILKKTRPDGANNGNRADASVGSRFKKKKRKQEGLSEGASKKKKRKRSQETDPDRAGDVKPPGEMNTTSVPERVSESVFLDALMEAVSADRLEQLMQNCGSEETAIVHPAQSGLD